MAAKAPLLSLLVNPGAPTQRVTHIVRADRPERRDWAEKAAMKKYGTAPLAWLNQETREVTYL